MTSSNLPLDYDTSQSAEHHRRHEATRIEQYMRRELAPLVRRELAPLVRRELDRRLQDSCFAIQEQLMNELEPIIQQCQSNLFKSYHQKEDAMEVTSQFEERTNGFGFRDSHETSLENYPFDHPAFTDLSPPLPPLPKLVNSFSLSGALEVDPSASSIAESDDNPPSFQNSSSSVSVNDHYHFEDYQQAFSQHSLGHLDEHIQCHSTDPLSSLDPDLMWLGDLGNCSSDVVPLADMKDDQNYNLGKVRG